MELYFIARDFYKAIREKGVMYNYKKVYFELYCCRNCQDFQMKESYKFDALYFYDYSNSIKLFYKNKLVVELTKLICDWVSAIYVKDKYMSFKLVDYSCVKVE